MGSSYQTILAVGEQGAVRGAVDSSEQRAVILAVGPQRWAVVPEPEETGAYAETEELAELISQAAGPAVTFEVYESEVLTARIFTGGQVDHEYLSDQGYLVESSDEDGNDVEVDFLGREYPDDEEPPAGPYGADPAEFLAFGVGEVDEDAVFEALRALSPAADQQHQALLRALGIPDVRPLTMTYAEALAA